MAIDPTPETKNGGGEGGGGGGKVEAVDGGVISSDDDENEVILIEEDDVDPISGYDEDDLVLTSVSAFLFLLFFGLQRGRKEAGRRP